MSTFIDKLLSEETVQNETMPNEDIVKTEKKKKGKIFPCITNILTRNRFSDYETATGAMYIVASSLLQGGHSKEEAWDYISELNDYTGNMVGDKMLEKIVNRGEKLLVGCSFISGMNFCVPKKCRLFKGNKEKV